MVFYCLWKTPKAPEDKNDFKTVNKTTIVRKGEKLTLPAQNGTSNSYYCLLLESLLTWVGSRLLYHMEGALK